MSIALTCDCGARYEVEDLFAGQEVSCPECQHRTRAPLVKDPPRRTSLLALYSLVVAVVGAFTLVGSAAAALIALIAMVRINTASVRLVGTGYAVAALVVSVVGAAATIGILYHPKASSLVGWQSRSVVAAQIDTSGPPEVGSKNNSCILTRPPGWGTRLQDRGRDLSIDYLQINRDIILASPQGDAYIDIKRDTFADIPLENYREQVSQELKVPPPLLDEADDNPGNPNAPGRFFLRAQLELPNAPDRYEGMEWVVDLRRGGRVWRWLLRAYRKIGDDDKARPVYVIRAYAPLRRFQKMETEMRKSLDGVRFPN